MEALAAKSLAEAVGERLMRAIAVGDLKPGARLNEAQMAAQLGVSRGPIREAARELEGQGFLISRTNQGFYVAAFSPEDIRDVYEAKDWLEAAFIADLAENMTTADRRAILCRSGDARRRRSRRLHRGFVPVSRPRHRRGSETAFSPI